MILRAPQRVQTVEEAKRIVDEAISRHTGMTTEGWGEAVSDLRVTVMVDLAAELVWRHKIAPRLVSEGWEDLSRESHPEINWFVIILATLIFLALLPLLVGIALQGPSSF